MAIEARMPAVIDNLSPLNHDVFQEKGTRLPADGTGQTTIMSSLSQQHRRSLSLDKALPDLPAAPGSFNMTRRSSSTSIHSTSTFDSREDDDNGAGAGPSRRQLDFSASLTSFPRPPSSIPPSASIRSVSALSHVDFDAPPIRAALATTPPREIRTHSRHASLQSARSGHTGEGRASPSGLSEPTLGSPSRPSAARHGHRAQVSLDAVPALPSSGSASGINALGADPSIRTEGSSLRSRPSSRVQHARARSARFAPDLQPSIPQRKQQHRMSMPIGASSGRSMRHSAVTPEFEQGDPIASTSFPLRSTSIPLGSRPVSRPMSPSMSDDEDDDEEEDEGGCGAYAAPMPRLTDSTLRSAPGVVGLGEGWAGGPQRKPRMGSRWWRRRRKSRAADAADDPLALWSVPEENARKTSPLKAAWNRSMLAFGLVGSERHAKGEEGPSAAQRARTFFSRSRLDLGQSQQGSEHGATGARTEQRGPRRRLFPLVSKSQNDLAMPVPSIHVDEASVISPSPLADRTGRGYSRQYAASQPHLPSPRSTSLSKDPFLSSARRGLPPPRRPISVSASGPSRGLTVPRIPEVDEPSTTQTSFGASASPSSSARRRGGARLKRSSTFGNGARDIASELGLDEHRPPSVISAGDGDVSGDEQPAVRRKTKTGEQRKSIMLGRPLITRLKTSLTSITRSSRSASPVPSIVTPGEERKGHKKGGRSQPGSEGSSSSAAPSTLLRTPVEAVMTVPLAPEAPVREAREVEKASFAKGKKRMSWFGGLNASRARLDEMDEDAERERQDDRPARPASRSFFRRSRRHPERRASIGTILDFEEGGADETARAREQAQAQAQRASWSQRRPFAASVPALNRLSGSEFNLLRFSFPKDDGFASMFDGLRFTPRPSPAPATPVNGAVPDGLPVPGAEGDAGASRDVVLADTMEILEGRRDSRTSTERAEGEDVVRDYLSGHEHVEPPESAPMRPDLSASTNSSASTVHPYNAGSGMVTPVRKTNASITVTSPSPLVTPSSHHTHASENTLSTLAPNASTPRARLSAQQGYFQALALAQAQSPEGRESGGPPSPTPAAAFAAASLGGNAAMLPAINTMPAPTSTFAWASRPGLPPRTGSFSSALSGRMGSVAGQSVRSFGSASPDEGVSPTMSMWHTPSGTPMPSPDPARPMQTLDALAVGVKSASAMGSPLPVFEEDTTEPEPEPEPEREMERRPSFGSAMRPYTFTPGISSASASASADSTAGSIAASVSWDGYGYDRRDSGASALLPPGGGGGAGPGAGAATAFGPERSRASLDAAFSGPVVGRAVAAGAGGAIGPAPRTTGVPVQVGLGYGDGLVASRDARLSKGSVASRASYEHELDEHESLEDADIVQYDSSRPRQISEMVRKGSLVAVEDLDLLGITPRDSIEEGRA